MDIKEVVKTAILRNSHEWGDEQAEAVLKAINEAGFVLIKSPITSEMQTAGKQILGLGMFGYDLQDAVDAMIKAQDLSHGI
jgi:hypothetical protein